jgi:hypothetical protein
MRTSQVQADCGKGDDSAVLSTYEANNFLAGVVYEWSYEVLW